MSSFPDVAGQSTGLGFLTQSRAFLQQVYLPKITACISRLSTEELWWRPNAACNSIGNLVLHLAGNARQWVVSGIGGATDIRVRREEFEAMGGIPGDLLIDMLRNTLADVDEVLDSLSETDLARTVRIQGFDSTVLQAVFHVVEHFSGHVGQITYLTKARVERDLEFYRIEDNGSVVTTW